MNPLLLLGLIGGGIFLLLRKSTPPLTKQQLLNMAAVLNAQADTADAALPGSGTDFRRQSTVFFVEASNMQ